MAETKNAVAKQRETNMTRESRNKVTDYSLGIFGTSDNFIMAMQMAKALSASTLVPREYQGNESNCLIAIDMSQRFGASPFEVMRNLDVIQGRPSWKASALIGMINASNKFDMELQFEEVTDKDGKPFSCRCWTTKQGRRVDGPIIDMNMAIAEKWVDKNGSKWKTMPQVMLRYRAASFFSRMNCPEISMGLYTSDEIIEGDFREYPIENVQEQVAREISQNANKEEFLIEESAQIEEKTPAPTVEDMTKAPEKEPVLAKKIEKPLPPFMMDGGM